MSVGIKASVNKFAFLYVQDSSEESDAEEQETLAARGQTPKQNVAGANASNAKKKARRRKKKHTNSTSSNVTADDDSQSQMRDWIQHDRNYVDNLYDEDLKLAIELSKVEYEKVLSEENSERSQGIDIPPYKVETRRENEVCSKSASPPKKERKKNKVSNTTSLEEFHQHIEKSLPLQKDERLTTVAAQPEKNSNFFEEVNSEVTYIRRNEEVIGRLRQEHQQMKGKHQRNEKTNKRDRRLQKEEEKDKLIENLLGQVSEWEQQFKHVKKRNKQLLVMLQQGEMKEKSELLLEIERLSNLRDELTQEVSSLNESLEQERSKSRKVKEELLKLQAKKSHEGAFGK